MLRSPVLYAGLSLAVLGSVLAVGCSSSTTDPIPDQLGIVPPARPADAPAGDGPGYTFAVNKLYLGDTDRNGTPSTTAWKKFGYNLDGKISDKASTDLCKPQGNAPPSNVYPDGDGGIDNAFGKLLMPTISGLAMNPTATVNEALADGDFTLIMRIDALGAGAAYNNLAGALYAGAKLDTPPLFNGMDNWPVVPELLNDPNDINSSKVKFPNSYLTENTWVSGDPASLDISVAVAGYALTLGITNASITMNIDPARSGATEGIIAGVLEVEPLIEELRSVAGSFDPNLCSGATFEGFAEQIRQSADILADGTQDASKTCNAISIGLGFEAKLIQPVKDVAAAAPAPPDPCAEGGAPPEGGMGGTSAAGGAGGAGGG